jgi:hypothetical protein
VEINSTVFLRRGGKWREVKHLRRGGAVSSYEGMMHMAKAAFSPCWVDAFVRSRIGKAWGFLPSQLGFRTYPSFLRERVLGSRRCFTHLPVRPGATDPRLRCIVGRDATPGEAEVLREFLWAQGRGGLMKRDSWCPSLGAIRRTYSYRARPYTSMLSYVGWARTGRATPRKSPVFFLPQGENTEEEEFGLTLLELWRAAVPLASE